MGSHLEMDKRKTLDEEGHNAYQHLVVFYVESGRIILSVKDDILSLNIFSLRLFYELGKV